MGPFRVGVTLIAGRYRLTRFIAQGGMGEVYEAFDEELRQKVAMKIVRRDVAANPLAMERFKREISLARRVTHPNVSRIFEYGRHTGEDGAVTFLTMELLDGPTLEDRIRQGGPLTPAEALPIVQQMCAGLSAAHEAGVVHRDFKSSNVILARQPDGGFRVVLTDFGLARALTGDDAATITLTATDLMVGTPAYMSPEQAQGFELTSRSDLYSLGVVLFEMVTGKFPHAGATPMAILMSRLKEPPPSPLVVMPALDPAWDAVIRRCLEVRADRRFESASDVARALRGEEVAPPPPLSPSELATETAAELPRGPVRRRAPGRWIAACAAAAVLAGLAFLALRSRGGDAVHPGGRRSAAVLGFKNLSGRPESAWLSTALSEMLTAELGAGEQLRTIPGETVARAKTELALPDTDALAPETLAKVGSVIGTDVVVLGSYFVASADPKAPLRVDLRLQSAAARGLDAVISETGTPEQVLVLVASLGRKLRSRLEIPEASPAQVATAHAAFPESAEAQRLYAEGLSRLRSFDLVEARKLLEQAADASPKNPLVRSALASCFTALGDDAHARDAAQTAFDLSGSLSREERLLIEAQLSEARKEWPKAVEDYHALFRFYPDDVEYALRLAGAETASGRAANALETLSQAAKLGPDPRVAVAQGTAEMALSRYKAALASARRAVDSGSRSGARLLVAQGRMLEGDALLRLGDHKGASAALEMARNLFAETGDRNAEAKSLNRIANVAFEEGDFDRARKGFDLARQRWGDAGNRRGAAVALANGANVLEVTGELAKAAPLFEQALASYRELGAATEAELAEINIAIVARRRGDPRRSLAVARSAVNSSRASGYPYGLVPALYTAAQASLALGRVSEAHTTVDEALGIARSTSDQRAMAFCLETLAEVRHAEGDLAKARGAAEEALGIRRAMNERADQVDSLAELGDLARDEGRASLGLPGLREAVRLARVISSNDKELVALVRLVRCAIAAQELHEARAASARATELAASSEDASLRLLAALARGEFALSTGAGAAARETFESVRDQARAAGFALLEGEASLLLTRTAGPARSEDSRRALLLLVHDAESRGLVLLARKARVEAAKREN